MTLRCTGLATVIMIMSFGIAGISRGADEVNLYFDEAGTVYEITDATYPAMLTGYLYLDSPSDSSGIGGWELRVSSDPNLILGAATTFYQCLNFTGFPNYMVAYGAPVLPVNDRILLATISVVALGPGRVYISANSQSGFTDVAGPVYISGDDPNIVHTLSVRDGLFGGATATVGVTQMLEAYYFPPVSISASCEELQPEPTTRLYSIPGNGEFWDVEVVDETYVFAANIAAAEIVRFGIYGNEQLRFALEPGYDEPRWLAADPARGYLYVRTQDMAPVLVYGYDGTLLATIGDGEPGNEVGHFYTGSIGPIALDDSGNLYVADQGDPPNPQRIQSFSVGQAWSPAIFAIAVGDPESPNFWFQAEDMALDGSGRLYILDGMHPGQIEPRVRVFQGGQGIAVWGHAGHDSTDLYIPVGIEVTSDNKVYIADEVYLPSMDRRSSGVQVHALDGTPIAEWGIDDGADGRGLDITESEPNFVYLATVDYGSGGSSIVAYGRRMIAINAMTGDLQNPDFSLIETGSVVEACYEPSAAMEGVTADSVASVLLLQDWPATLSGSLTLEDVAQPGNSQGLGTLISIDGEDYGGTIPFTTFDYDTRHRIAAYFAGPMDFVRTTVISDRDSMERIVSANVDISSSFAAAADCYSRHLKIVRTPVLFLHGLFGGKAQFGKYIGIRDNPKWTQGVNWDDIDYSTQHGAAFEETCTLIDTHVDNVRTAARGRGLVVGQVDFVAHSMGGVLLRYLKDTGVTAPNGPPYAYRSYENRGFGDYHKILFYNVPHKGSPLARDMSDLMDYIVFGPEDEFIARGLGARLVEWYMRQRGPVHSSFSAAYGLGLLQLRDDSPEIASLGDFDVPSYSVVGVGGSDLHSSPAARWATSGIAYALSLLTTPPGIIEMHGGEHDGVVPRSSQEPGLRPETRFIAHDYDGLHESLFQMYRPYQTDFTKDVSETWAVRPVRADSMQQTIVHNDALKSQVIAGAPARYEKGALNWIPATMGPNFSVTVTVFGAPASSVIPSQAVMLKAIPAPNAAFDVVIIRFGDQYVTLPAPAYEAAVTVPSDAIGGILVQGAALTQAGELVFSRTAEVAVNLNYTMLTGIDCNPDAITLTRLGGTSRIVVAGDFSDGVTRDLTYDGAVFSGWNSAVIDICGDGTIVAVGQGSTVVSVTCEGLSTEIEVDVIDGGRVYSRPIANAGGEYEFCAMRRICLDASGSYDYDQSLGELLTYAWDLDGDGVFDDSHAAQPCTYFDDASSPRFVSLRVTDSEGRVGYDYAMMYPVIDGCMDASAECELTGLTDCELWDVEGGGGGAVYISSGGSGGDPAINRMLTSCELDSGFGVSDNSLARIIHEAYRRVGDADVFGFRRQSGRASQPHMRIVPRPAVARARVLAFSGTPVHPPVFCPSPMRG